LTKFKRNVIIITNNIYQRGGKIMGRRVTIIANSQGKAKRRFNQPLSIMLAFALITVLAILSFQAIAFVITNHRSSIRHTITIQYEHVILPPNILSNTDCPFTFTQKISVKTNTLFDFVPQSNHPNEVFSGWFTCENHLELFDLTTPITKNMPLFGYFIYNSH